MLLLVLLLDDVYELDNFPHFKTLVDAYSSNPIDDKDGPNKVLVILAGDFLAPSLIAFWASVWMFEL
jgi:hypothetical protein